MCRYESIFTFTLFVKGLEWSLYNLIKGTKEIMVSSEYTKRLVSSALT